uniref:Large ribosomal subunit protein uL22m n=1 Tax=Lepeophtheirus salmonis TaxID=72036 RepID=A0A0K2TAG7_LEPSM
MSFIISRIVNPSSAKWLYRSLSTTQCTRKMELGNERWHEPSSVPGTSKTYMWPSYNERVHLPEEGLIRPAYVTHMRSMIKHSPKRMWYYASFVRGLTVDEALKQLSFIDRKGAHIIREVIEEAVELAVAEHDVEYRTNLWIAESLSDVCDRIKGYRRHARMRFGIVEYKYVNYYVRLEEGRPPKHYYSVKEAKTPEEQLNEWLNEHRRKEIPRI